MKFNIFKQQSWRYKGRHSTHDETLNSKLLKNHKLILVTKLGGQAIPIQRKAVMCEYTHPYILTEILNDMNFQNFTIQFALHTVLRYAKRQ